MPTFNPPLGRETNVPIGSSDAERYVHLRFTLTFEPAENASGSWELWTDIPDVNADGAVMTGQGEWRSVSFADQTIGRPQEEGTAQNAPSGFAQVITLPSTPIVPDVLPAKVELVAEMVVPARNASYAYTYRRVLTSGETHWLGNGGDNGVVRVIESEAVEQSKAAVEWKGFGIELPSDGSVPRLHDLPNEEASRASIILLRSVPPAVQPISQLCDKPTKGLQAANSSLIILSDGLKPVSIEAKATSPVASGIKYHYDDLCNLSALLRDACREQSQIQPGSGGLDDEVVTLLYCPQGTPSTSYLIVFAPELKQDRTLKPLLPTLASDKAPIALSIVTDSGDQSHISVPADQILDSVLHLPAGKVASIVEIDQFLALSQSDDPPVWIAGVRSLTQRTVDVASVPAPKAVTCPLDSVEEAGSESPSTEMTASITSTTDSQSEDSVPTESERSVAVKQETSTILHFIRRFFLGLWSWLFGPFSSAKPARQSFSARDDGSIESSTGVQTPHEGTPLLGTPRISQSPSSTAVSAFGSPQKAGAAMLKTDSATSTGTSTSTYHDMTSVPDPSAIHFTFAQSPFRFLLAPGLSAQTFVRLNFTYHRQGEQNAKKEAVPTRLESQAVGDCDQLVIEAKGKDGPWNVQVEVK